MTDTDLCHTSAVDAIAAFQSKTLSPVDLLPSQIARSVQTEPVINAQTLKHCDTVLAAGTATLATGSDIGGPIRIPAGACDVVGYEPPYGRNPEESPFPWISTARTAVWPTRSTIRSCCRM